MEDYELLYHKSSQIIQLAGDGMEIKALQCNHAAWLQI